MKPIINRESKDYKECLERISRVKKQRRKRLDLSGLKLSVWPPALFRLSTQITELVIGIESVETEAMMSIIQNFKKLTYLEAGFNNLGDKEAIAIADNLKYLRTLLLSKNKISDNGAVAISRNLKKLIILDLSYNEITDNGVVEISQNIPRLTHLYLGGNTKIGLAAAQAIGENLHTLIELDLSNSKIGSIGLKYIADNLKSLAYLSINNCKIESTQAIEVKGNFEKLESLFLSNNAIGDLGVTAIANNLKNLHTLFINNTGVSDAGIETLVKKRKNLISISIDDNNLSLKSAIVISKNLTFLSELSIRNNIIGNEGLKALYNTYKYIGLNIYFDNNGYHDIPESELRSWGTVCAYWASIENEPTVRVNAVNVLLLGNTTSGKSSLLRYYLHKEFDEDNKSTFGITHLNFIRKNIHFSFWDFGGQEYFHGTHRLFIGAYNAIFLILYEPKFEKAEYSQDYDGNACFPILYWLNTIKHFSAYLHGKDSNLNKKIMLIQTKIDIEPYQPEILSLSIIDPKGRHKVLGGNLLGISVKGAFEAPKGNNKLFEHNWKDFNNKLASLVERYKSSYIFNEKIIEIKENLPKWREECKKKRTLYYSKRKFKEICEVVYPKAERHIDLIKRYLENCGEIICFPIAGIEDYIFMDPSRLLNAIYSILNDNVRRKNGVFSIEELKHIPQSKVIVKIMQHMELIFINPKCLTQFIAPQYLSNNHDQVLLEKLKSKLHNLFSIRFPDYIPRAFITQFISRKGGHTAQGTFWKFGVAYTACMSNIKIDVLVEVAQNNKVLEVYVEDCIEKFIAAEEVFRFFVFNENIDSITNIDIEANLEMIGHIELGIQSNFASINDIYYAILNKSLTVKSAIDNSYMQILPIFYHLLNKVEQMKKKIFISYSHFDRRFLTEFEKHFALLQKENMVEIWHDELLPLGTEWDNEIANRLDSADMIIYLLSPSFMNSKYIWEKEIDRVSKSKKKIFVPIFVSPCDFESSILGSIQGAPLNNHLNIEWIATISNKAKRDVKYLEIVKKIRNILI